MADRFPSVQPRRRAMRGGRLRRMARLAGVASLVLLAPLAACTEGGFQGDAGAHPHLFGPWQSVEDQRIGLRLAGSNPLEVIAARVRQGHDGLEVYEAVFTNDTLDYGENLAIVAVRDRPDNRPLSLDSDVVTFEFTPEVIHKNFDVLLKGAEQKSTPAQRRNRYGPYHFVTAQYPGGARCIYAWQHVDNDKTPFSGGASDAAVQFRYCDPSRSAADMAELFDSIILEL
jgi:hypothetical protein